MAIIKKYNKTNNTTYVYESISYWDKEKKQPRSKRKLIGKIDPDTGEIVPTEKRGRRSKTLPTSPKSLADSVNDETFTNISKTSDEDITESPDYQKLYEVCRLELLDKTVRLTKLENTIADLTKERDHLIRQLEDILFFLRR